MKSIFSIFLLTLYLSTIFSSFIPYVEYVFNYDYISKVLCINKEEPKKNCNGKCYLKKQILKVENVKNPNNENSLPSIEIENKLSPAIIAKTNLESELNFIDKGKIFTLHVFYSLEFYCNIFRPPIAIA